MRATKYIDAVNLEQQVESLNKSAIGKKEEKKYPSTEMAALANKFIAYYKKINPNATERQVARAVNRKFWSGK